MNSQRCCYNFKLKYLVLISAIVIITTTKLSSQSQVEGYQNKRLFATKTGYQLSKSNFANYLENTLGVMNYMDISIAFDDDGSKSSVLRKLHPEGCYPKQLTVLLRHGTRYPSKGDIGKVAELLPKFEKLNVKKQYHKLKMWENIFTHDNEKVLADAGFQENVGIAQSFFDAFPQLFKGKTRDKIRVVASDTQRTKASAEGFITGIGTKLDIDKAHIVSNIQIRNDLLRFFDDCSSYKQKVDGNKDALVEFEVFKQSDAMRRAAQAVSKRVSASGEEDDLLNTDDIRTMWAMCGTETALFNNGSFSSWCDLLTNEETRVLEYAWDLKSFWKKSYGYTLNYEQSCPLLTDILMNFHRIINNNSAPSVSAYFGHAETLMPFHALLGLFQDHTTLTASNYQKLEKTRKFRTSLTSSFAANLALVLYDCQPGAQADYQDWPEELDNTMVQLVANEHVIPFPFTRDLAVSIADFETQYYQYIHHCEFDKLCENEPTVIKLNDEL